MPQTAQNKTGILLKNANPRFYYTSFYAMGDRPAGGTLLAAGNWQDGQLNPASVVNGFNWSAWGGAQVTNGVLSLPFPDPVGSGFYGPTLELVIPTGYVLSDAYVEFDARFPGNVNGSKFVKFFGRRNGDNYHNSTFNLLWGTGDFANILFSDGSDVAGDASHVIPFDSQPSPQNIGRGFGTAVVQVPQGKIFSATDWGNEWHHFKFRYKQNDGTTSGNEVPNGAFYVEIDGDVYLDAQNLFNRHHTNEPGLSKIEFGGWAQGGGGAFEMQIDNVRVSAGGFI